MKNRMNLKLACIQFFLMAAYASYFNFFILFLTEKGYSKFDCGMIQAFIAIITFLYQPIIGHITDRYLSYKKTVSISMISLMLFTIIIPKSADVILLMGMFVVLHAVTMRQLPTLIDGWTVAIKGRHKEVNYANTRSIGSIGAGLASIFMGIIIGYWGYDKVFLLNGVLVLIAFLLIQGLEDINEEHKLEEKVIPFKGALKQLFTNKVYMTFMFSALFLNIGIKIINTFGPIMMEEVGGNSVYYGYTMFACGIVEALTFVVAGKLMKKVKMEIIYISAIVFLGVGSILIFVTQDITYFIIGRIIMGMTYSIYVVMVVGYVAKLIAPALKATAMGVLVAGTGGIAQIFSSLGGGFILEKLNIRGATYAMMALVVITFILFLPNIIRQKKDKML